VRILVVQHDDDSDLRSLAPPLRAANATLEVWVSHRRAAPTLPFCDYDGVVVLGGIVNPDQDDEHAWLATERFCLEAALRHAIPTLGVCLGGQLLAQVAGGRAYRSPAPEIGWYPILAGRSMRDDVLFGGFPARFDAFEWHEYRFDPPPDAVRLASNANATQAFRVGERAWGIQFHIEADEPTVNEWLDIAGDDARASGVDVDAVRIDTARHGPAQRALCTQLGERFAAVVAAYAGDKNAARPARTS